MIAFCPSRSSYGWILVEQQASFKIPFEQYEYFTRLLVFEATVCVLSPFFLFSFSLWITIGLYPISHSPSGITMDCSADCSCGLSAFFLVSLWITIGLYPGRVVYHQTRLIQCISGRLVEYQNLELVFLLLCISGRVLA